MIGLATIDPPPAEELEDMGISRKEWLQQHAPPLFDPDIPRLERLHVNHAFIVTAVNADAGTVTVVNPWDPVGGEVTLSEGELASSTAGVFVNATPDGS